MILGLIRYFSALVSIIIQFARDYLPGLCFVLLCDIRQDRFYPEKADSCLETGLLTGRHSRLTLDTHRPTSQIRPLVGRMRMKSPNIRPCIELPLKDGTRWCSWQVLMSPWSFCEWRLPKLNVGASWALWKQKSIKASQIPSLNSTSAITSSSVYSTLQHLLSLLDSYDWFVTAFNLLNIYFSPF